MNYDNAIRKACLEAAAVFGKELGAPLVKASGEYALGRLVRQRMIFRDGSAGVPSTRLIILDIYKAQRGSSLLAYCEVVPRGALPNRFKPHPPSGGHLIVGKNRCWNIEPRRGSSDLNVKKSVAYRKGKGVRHTYFSDEKAWRAAVKERYPTAVIVPTTNRRTLLALREELPYWEQKCGTFKKAFSHGWVIEEERLPAGKALNAKRTARAVRRAEREAPRPKKPSAAELIRRGGKRMRGSGKAR
jgi:hypothetical protein